MIAASAKGDIRPCPYALLEAALSAGWEVCADLTPTHHGYYAPCLVQWPHDRPATWPPEGAEQAEKRGA